MFLVYQTTLVLQIQVNIIYREPVFIKYGSPKEKLEDTKNVIQCCKMFVLKTYINVFCLYKIVITHVIWLCICICLCFSLKINKLQKSVIIIRKLKDSQYHVQRKTDEKTMFYHTVKGTSLKNRGWNRSLWKGK